MTKTQKLHATSVDIEGRGVLICGTSGSGKSSLALSMIGLGAKLVADDQTFINQIGDHLTAHGTPHLRGIIEARGLGLVRVPSVEVTEVCLMIDMDHKETQRIPDPIHHEILGILIKKINSCDGMSFAPAVYYFVKNGEVDL